MISKSLKMRVVFYNHRIFLSQLNRTSFIGLTSRPSCQLRFIYTYIATELTVIISIPILGLYDPFLSSLPSPALSPTFSSAFAFAASRFFFSSALLLWACSPEDESCWIVDWFNRASLILCLTGSLMFAWIAQDFYRSKALNGWYKTLRMAGRTVIGLVSNNNAYIESLGSGRMYLLAWYKY